MGIVIYLTGAPATGKSTLCKDLIDRVQGIKAYSYSELLRDHINRNTVKQVDEIGIRCQSGSIVTNKSVAEIDKWLVNEIQTKRVDHNIIIDSHAVTKEHYGFRITPYTPVQLSALDPDMIICLYAEPSVIAERILEDPAGRPLPSLFELSLHVELQSSLAAQYSFVLGKPIHLIDSSMEPDTVVDQLISLTQLEVT
ncbi:MAG: AAA family ATPase [Candidatus Thiodiazotropha sp. (ex Lucinoma borealis)]|nr:AAA family ATPase [Candidatus Thiodiazotropha sp. (ex Lucinoma borealis)]